MRKPTLFLILFLSSFRLFSQTGFTPRFLVDTLCSRYFFGRGYVNDGVNRAAYFLSIQMDSLGLKPFGKNYLQEFPLTVNTFPERLLLEIDGVKLVTGQDFQVLPESGGGKDKLKITLADTTQSFILNNSESVILLPASWLSRLSGLKKQALISQLAERGPVIIESTGKLTWSVGREQFRFPVFEVQPQFLQKAKTARYVVDAVVARNYYANNVCAFVPGTTVPDSFLVFTAHYDHLGGMGMDTWIQGANDNASGTAMLMHLAAYYKKNPHKYSVAFIAFAGEEAGLVGSQYFVDHPLIKLGKIKFLFNLDLMGTGAEGATVVNATVFPEQFSLLQEVNKKGGYLPVVNPRGPAANSDHYWFSEKGVPSFFMYLLDSKYTAYHHISDRKEDLPLTKFNETMELLIDFYNSWK